MENLIDETNSGDGVLTLIAPPSKRTKRVTIENYVECVLLLQ